MPARKAGMLPGGPPQRGGDAIEVATTRSHGEAVDCASCEPGGRATDRVGVDSCSASAEGGKRWGIRRVAHPNGVGARLTARNGRSPCVKARRAMTYTAEPACPHAGFRAGDGPPLLHDRARSYRRCEQFAPARCNGTCRQCGMPASGGGPVGVSVSTWPLGREFDRVYACALNALLCKPPMARRGRKHWWASHQWHPAVERTGGRAGSGSRSSFQVAVTSESPGFWRSFRIGDSRSHT